jgi:hypothetical protein
MRATDPSKNGNRDAASTALSTLSSIPIFCPRAMMCTPPYFLPRVNEAKLRQLFDEAFRLSP